MNILRRNLFVVIVCLFISNLAMGQQAPDTLRAGKMPQVTHTVTEAQVRKITSQLIAPCCWSETVDVHKSAASLEVRDAVVKMLQNGQSEDAIKAAMVAQYGERILATPKMEGFNYFIFILPILALLIGGYIVWEYLKRPETEPKVSKENKAPLSKTTDAYDSRIEQELKNFDD